MVVDFRFGAIAALVSLFLSAPLPSGDAVDRPAARLSFPVPTLRTVGLPDAGLPKLDAGQLEPVAVAAEIEAPKPILKKNIADAAPVETTTPVLAAVGLSQPQVPPAQLQDAPLEEFPGAVAVAVPRLAANAKWRRIVDERPGELHATQCAGSSAEQCAASPWSRWHALVQRVSTLEGEERLQAVNEGINALLTYASDDEIYGVGDHWATLQESMARGRGDCEDIAIAKMWLLNAAGVDLSSMRLVVLKDTLRNLDHAVLSVVEDGHQYVLDNTAWKVGRADWMRGYRPIYALSSEQSWIYGTGVPTATPVRVAQIAAPALPQ